MSYQQGDRVRFLVGPLGLVTNVYSPRFEEASVKEGDVGTYESPHPTLAEEDWHVVKVGELFCPVHDYMIEPAS